MQSGLHTGLHAVLPEGQGAGGDPFPRGTAIDQGVGIGLFALFPKLTQNLFVAGKLDILAQKDIPHPQQGVEPIHRKEQESQGLPKVILPLQMGFFVGDDEGGVFFRQERRQINPRTEHTEQEGGVHPVASPDVFFYPNRLPQSPFQQEEADKEVQHHPRHADDPHPSGNLRHHLHGVDRVPGSGSKGILQKGIHHGVYRGDPALDGGLFRLQDLMRHRLPGGQEAQGALDGKRQ